MDRYLSEAEKCAIFGPSRRTAQRERATSGGPPFVRVSARRIAYRQSDCETFYAARTFQHRAAELARQAEQKHAERPSPPRRRRPAEAQQSPK